MAGPSHTSLLASEVAALYCHKDRHMVEAPEAPYCTDRLLVENVHVPCSVAVAVGVVSCHMDRHKGVGGLYGHMELPWVGAAARGDHKDRHMELPLVAAGAWARGPPSCRGCKKDDQFNTYRTPRR